MFVSCKRELNITRIEFMCIRVLLKQQLLIRESPFIDYRISRATFRDLEKEERYIFESKPKNPKVFELDYNNIMNLDIVQILRWRLTKYIICSYNIMVSVLTIAKFVLIFYSYLSHSFWYTLYFYCCCYHANANPWRRDSFLLVLQYSARKYAAYTSLIYFLFALYTTMYTSFRLVRFSLFLNIFSSCLGKHRGNDTWMCRREGRKMPLSTAYFQAWYKIHRTLT